MDNDLGEDMIGKCMNNADIKDNNINASWFLIDKELGEISERIDEVESAGL